jgi:hypothetical protein
MPTDAVAATRHARRTPIDSLAEPGASVVEARASLAFPRDPFRNSRRRSPCDVSVYRSTNGRSRSRSGVCRSAERRPSNLPSPLSVCLGRPSLQRERRSLHRERPSPNGRRRRSILATLSSLRARLALERGPLSPFPGRPSPLPAPPSPLPGPREGTPGGLHLHSLLLGLLRLQRDDLTPVPETILGHGLDSEVVQRARRQARDPLLRLNRLGNRCGDRT